MFSKILNTGKIIFLLLVLNSCLLSKNYYKKGQIRVVDSRGKVSNIERTIPAFNQQQLYKQQKLANIKIINEDHHKNLIKTPKIPNNIFADKITDEQVVINTKPDKNQKQEKSKEIIENKKQETVKKSKNNVVVLNDDDSQKPKNKEIFVKIRKPNEKVMKLNAEAETPVNLKRKKAIVRNQYYIQIGAYKIRENAKKALNKYKKISNGVIKDSNKNLYLVLLGPYSTKKQAETHLEKVINTGHYDVFIVPNAK